MENRVQLFINDRIQAEDLGIVNPNFTTDLIGWTLGNNWLWYNGRIINRVKSGSTFSQVVNLTAGVTYKIKTNVYIYGREGDTDPGYYVRFQLGDVYYDVTSQFNGEFELTPTVGTNLSITKVGCKCQIDYIIAESSYVDNYQEIELYDESSIQLNMSIAEVEDITKRNITYSQSFTIPGTNTNNQLFNYLYNLDINEPVIYLNKQINCSLYYSDTKIMKGFLELTKVYLNENTGLVEYEANVFSNIKTFSNILNESYVTGNSDTSLDIDFGNYNHTLNITNITNSWTATPGTGYYYPVMNYNNLQNGNLVIEDFRPALYASEIFDKIMDKVGYTYTSTFLNSAEFKSLVIPCTTDMTTDQNELNTRGVKVGLSADYSFPEVSSNDGYSIRTHSIPLNDETSFDFFDSGNTYNNSTYINTIAKKGLYQFSVNTSALVDLYMNNLATVQAIFPFNRTSGERPKVAVNVFLYLRRGGIETQLASSTTYFYLNSQYIAAKDAVIGTLSTQLNAATMSSPLTFEVGDQIYFKATIYNNYNRWSNAIGADIGANSNVQNAVYAILKLNRTNISDTSKPGTFFKTIANASPYLFEGDTVNLNQVFPTKVKKIDFMTSIFKMFNLIVDIDPNSDTNLIIDTRDNYFSSGSSLNWTSKIDRNSNFEIERIPNLIDSDIIFTYQNDKDDLNVNYTSLFPDRIFGDKQILTTGVTADNQFKIDVMFSPTPSQKIPNTDLIAPKLFTTGTGGKLSANNFNVRILYRTPVELWSSAFANQITTANPRVRIAYKDGVYINGGYLYTASHFDNPYLPTKDLNWDTCFKYYQLPVSPCYDTLYNRFWKKQIDQLNDQNSKKVTCYANLTELDIFNFTFADQIQVDEQFYIVNKIENWKPDALTKIELLKLIEPNLPITDPDKKTQWIKDWEWNHYQFQEYIVNPINKFDGLEAIESNQIIPKLNFNRYDVEGLIETGVTSATTVEYVTAYTQNYATIVTGKGYNIGNGGSIAAENFFVAGVNNNISNSNNISVVGDNNIVESFTKNITVVGDDNYVPSTASNVFIFGNNLSASTTGSTFLISADTFTINGVDMTNPLPYELTTFTNLTADTVVSTYIKTDVLNEWSFECLSTGTTSAKIGRIISGVYDDTTINFAETGIADIGTTTDLDWDLTSTTLSGETTINLTLLVSGGNWDVKVKRWK